MIKCFLLPTGITCQHSHKLHSCLAHQEADLYEQRINGRNDGMSAMRTLGPLPAGDEERENEAREGEREDGDEDEKDDISDDFDSIEDASQHMELEGFRTNPESNQNMVNAYQSCFPLFFISPSHGAESNHIL